MIAPFIATASDASWQKPPLIDVTADCHNLSILLRIACLAYLENMALLAYLNRIYYGHLAYGIESDTQTL